MTSGEQIRFCGGVIAGVVLFGDLHRSPAAPLGKGWAIVMVRLAVRTGRYWRKTTLAALASARMDSACPLSRKLLAGANQSVRAGQFPPLDFAVKECLKLFPREGCCHG
jgi:hypothetical protein